MESTVKSMNIPPFPYPKLSIKTNMFIHMRKKKQNLVYYKNLHYEQRKVTHFQKTFLYADFLLNVHCMLTLQIFFLKALLILHKLCSSFTIFPGSFKSVQIQTLLNCRLIVIGNIYLNIYLLNISYIICRLDHLCI